MSEIDSVSPSVGEGHAFDGIRLEELVSKVLSESGEDGVGAVGTRLETTPHEKPGKREK